MRCIPDFDISKCYKGPDPLLKEVWVKRGGGWTRCRYYELSVGDIVFQYQDDWEFGQLLEVRSEPCKEVSQRDPGYYTWGAEYLILDTRVNPEIIRSAR